MGLWILSYKCPGTCWHRLFNGWCENYDWNKNKNHFNRQLSDKQEHEINQAYFENSQEILTQTIWEIERYVFH